MQTTTRENWLIAGIVVVALLLIFSWMGGKEGTNNNGGTATSTDNGTSTSTSNGSTSNGTTTEEVEGLPGENAGTVIISDQPEGNAVIVDRVNFENAGWIFIREYKDGQPGTILGARCYRPGTNNGNMSVELVTRPTYAGATYLAELRDDNNDNCTYDGLDEARILDAEGNAVYTTFKATLPAGSATTTTTS